MKPVWHLSEILAAHKGLTDWTEPIVSDSCLHADYISMGPGGKTPRRFNADTREWWIIQDGQIRFTIEGQEPFVASCGFRRRRTLFRREAEQYSGLIPNTIGA